MIASAPDTPRPRSRPASPRPPGPFLLLAVLMACGADAPADATRQAPIGTPEARRPAQGAPFFDQSVEDDECALLSREAVSEAAGVPMDAVERPYDAVCLYSWNAGADYPAGNLNLMDVDVHETMAAARAEYDRFTEDVTAGELGAYDHQHWEGIGTAASTDGRGTVRILYGNVTVWVTGKTDGEDWIDPSVGRAVARSIVGNLEGMR